MSAPRFWSRPEPLRPLRRLGGSSATRATTPVQSPAKALDVTPAEIVARWIAGVSEDARRAYSRALRTFTGWALPDAEDPQDGLRLLCESGAGGAHELMSAWRDHMLERLAPGTVASAVSAISSLLRCCRRAGLITFGIEGVAPKRERVQDRSGPRFSDVERLLAHVDELAAAGKPRAVRDAAIIRCLYCCAMRRGEVAGLRLEDVNLEAAEGPTVSPRRKGARTRQSLIVSERTAAAIVAWLAVRGNEPGALFHRVDRPADRRRLSGEAIRHLLKMRAKVAGVKAPCRPHGLRRSAATRCATHGGLGDLAKLGWRSPASAMGAVDDLRPITNAPLLGLMNL
jgi:integrase/recombinase XerC